MYIVFDIGGTNMRLAASPDKKSLGQTAVLPTPKNFADALQLLESEIKTLAAGQKIDGIAGGVPGCLTPDKRGILSAANLPDWSGHPLVEKLEEVFDCPVKLENDATIGALGEARFGVAKGYKSVVYIAVGTGIGGAWILDDKPVEGHYTTNIGHQTIDPKGLLCPAHQQPGHWEAYRKHPEFKYKYFMIGLYNTLSHWPADIVVLGGGVILNHNWSPAEIENQLKETKFGRHNITVKIASLGDEAGLHGALSLL